MIIRGAALISEGTCAPSQQVKAILNESGAVFFPASLQHSSVKIDGLSYEDDYLGNALAAIVSFSAVEIRGHRDFSTERVKSIWSELLRTPEAKKLQTSVVRYQGRAITDP